MSEFAALITGSIAGALMKADHLLIDVFMPTDDDGNYLKEVRVRGRESDEWLRITIEPMEPLAEDTSLPEDYAESAK